MTKDIQIQVNDDFVHEAEITIEAGGKKYRVRVDVHGQMIIKGDHMGVEMTWHDPDGNLKEWRQDVAEVMVS